jgi:hypothetical protein
MGALMSSLVADGKRPLISSLVADGKRPLLVALAAFMLLACAGDALAQGGRAPVALGGFSYTDTSGEPRDQAADHEAWLAMFGRLLRADIEKAGKFAITDFQCPAPECTVTEGVAPEVLVNAAGKAGARYLVFGGVQKTSTLVQWARLSVLDLESRRIVVDRLFSFRGDNEEAWRHAAIYVSGYVNDIGSGAVGRKP